MNDQAQIGGETTPRSSRLSSAIVVLICVLPIVSAIAYGAVDLAAIGLLSLFGALIALLWMTEAWRLQEFPYSTSWIQLPLFGLLLLGCIQLLPLGSSASASLLSVPVSNTISMDPYATRFFVIRLGILFIFFCAAMVFVPQGSRAKRIAAVIVIFGALIAFFGILQRLATPDSIYGLRPTPQAIPFGPYVNQHHFAALMEMTSGVALGLVFGRGSSRERKIFIGIAAGIMGMAIIFTGSRGGMISYLAVIAFAAGTSLVRGPSKRGESSEPSRKSRNLLVMTAAGGLVVLILGSVLFLGGEQSLLRGIGLQENQADVTSGRAHFWNVAWQIFLASPILGAGFDAFGVAFSRYDTWNGTFRIEQAHNDYLQILADGGILAFACVLVFVYLLLKNGIVAITREKDGLTRSIISGALAGCFGILIHSFFDFPLRTPANAFFFLLLVVLAVGTGSVRRLSER